MFKAKPLKKAIAAFAESDSEDEDLPQAGHQKRVAPLIASHSSDDEDNEQNLDEDPEDTADLFEGEDLHRKNRYMKGLGGHFVPAGYQEQVEQGLIEDARAVAQKREKELEKALEGVYAVDKRDASDEQDDDPLESFMHQVHDQVRQAKEGEEKESHQQRQQKKNKAVRIDMEHDEEELKEDLVLKKMQERNALEKLKLKQTNAADNGEDDDEEEGDEDREEKDNPHASLLKELEYDSDGNPITPVGGWKKDVDPLPPVAHELENYEAFCKDFYVEHEEVRHMSAQEQKQLRQDHQIHVSGFNPPRMVTSFAHFGFDQTLMNTIKKHAFVQPTPIQCQAVPCALAGRDLMAISETGSGKTAAFVWPMLIHTLDQKPLEKGDGPIGLVLAPTRELAHQIYVECKSFAKPLGLDVVVLYGGVNKGDQFKELRAKLPELVIATPGRLIDMVKLKGTNLKRVTYLVLDEADRMFDLGFEPQVRSICNHVRPDRQCLLLSATFKKAIEKLAREVLTDPVRILVGNVDSQTTHRLAFNTSLNPHIEQRVFVLQQDKEKWIWLTHHLRLLLDAHPRGSILIFGGKKESVVELAKNITSMLGEPCGSIHGDMMQHEREKILHQFKRPVGSLESLRLLVSTDMLARGLDVSHLQVVINYELPRDMESYIHRIGRTGRSGQHLEKGMGLACTLVTPKEAWFASKLVQILESQAFSRPWITRELSALADKHQHRRAPKLQFAPPPSAMYPPPSQSQKTMGAKHGREEERRPEDPAQLAAATLKIQEIIAQNKKRRMGE